MIISLLGTLTLKFLDIEGDNQSIKIQLPDYVLANYIYTERKPRVSLISGSMVLVDEMDIFCLVVVDLLPPLPSFNMVNIAESHPCLLIC